MNKKKITIALLDMYDGAPNQGMRCLIDIINRFSPLVSFDIYDVGKCELPEINQYDIYISTGGPGDPLVGDGSWDTKYYELIDALTKWNLENPVKKACAVYLSFLSDGLQTFCLAEITKRNDTSFGVMKMKR
jgi:hypothetical protein